MFFPKTLSTEKLENPKPKNPKFKNPKSQTAKFFTKTKSNLTIISTLNFDVKITKMAHNKMTLTFRRCNDLLKRTNVKTILFYDATAGFSVVNKLIHER